MAILERCVCKKSFGQKDESLASPKKSWMEEMVEMKCKNILKELASHMIG